MKHTTWTVVVIFLIAILAPISRGQQITVTGTVKDSNGSVYAGGSGVAVLVPQNVAWTIGGTNPVPTIVPISQLDSFGRFTITLTSTAVIDQQISNPQWQLSFSSAQYQSPSTKYSFTMTPISLTSSQDITTLIVPQAAVLPVSGGGGGSGCSVVGSVGTLQKSNGVGSCAASSLVDNGVLVSTAEPINAAWLTANFFQSNAANPAQSGLQRLASTDQICFRNNANSADLCISKNSSDALLYNGVPIGGSGSTASANQFYAGPVSGSPAFATFRFIAAADLPIINLASSSPGGVIGNLPVANLNAGLGATSSTFWSGNATWQAVAGTLSGLTTGFLVKAASSSTAANTLCDEAITTANTITCTDSAGIVAPIMGTTGSNGGITMPEGTGGSLTAGAAVDLLYPDSTLHCVHANFNNVDKSCLSTQTQLTTGTSVTLVVPKQYFVCTSTCTVTVPVPAAGYEFCVMNDDNVSTVITLAAIGSSARYENTARTAYGTAGTGTFVSGGNVGDKVCIVGRDSTHYLTTAYNGTWVVN